MCQRDIPVPGSDRITFCPTNPQFGPRIASARLGNGSRISMSQNSRSIDCVYLSTDTPMIDSEFVRARPSPVSMQ